MYKPKRKLRKLSNKQIAEDVKKYIRSSHEFYTTRVPELKTLSKRLHEEYDLNDFYKVFNRLWKSGYREKYIAINTLQLYNEQFDLTTWKFLKPKLKEIKSLDIVDIVGSEIIGYIFLRHPELEDEILELARSKDLWMKRMVIVSALQFIKNKEFRNILKLMEICIHNKEEYVQKALGWMLREIGNQDPEFLKRFLIQNKNMPERTFFYATENLKGLRRIRKPLIFRNRIRKFFSLR